MSSVPVLMYHHVAPDRAITPSVFEAQLRWLRDNGYQALDTAALRDHLEGRRPAPGRSVVLTFDDGYADNWVHAFPLLRRFEMRATFFVVTGRVADAPRSRPTAEAGGSVPDTISDERAPAGFMSWAELRAAAESGVVEIGSHTHTHRDWDRHGRWTDLLGELTRSRSLIEEKAGTVCSAFAWPWGQYDEDSVRLLPQAGYATGFTTRIGPNLPGTDPFRICRLDVRRGEIAWFARRVWLYEQPLLSRLYGRVHGLDRSLKRSLLRSPRP